MYSKYVTREYLILFTYRNSIFIYLLTGIKAIILKSISVWKSLRIDDLCNETHLTERKKKRFQGSASRCVMSRTLTHKLASRKSYFYLFALPKAHKYPFSYHPWFDLTSIDY